MAIKIRWAFVLMLIAVPLLTACGKKNSLSPPPGEEQTFPKKFPRR